MSSADNVSSNLGRASGRPLRFFRGLLITRDGVARGGSSVWGIDGELDGDCDMRVSSSCSSSVAFLFLADMALNGGEGAVSVRKASLARNVTQPYLIWRGIGGLGEGEVRTAAA
jgi:hypothetical protein